MFIIPIQELDEIVKIVNVISGVVMPRQSPLMQEQPWAGDIDEEERDAHLTGKK